VECKIVVKTTIIDAAKETFTVETKSEKIGTGAEAILKEAIKGFMDSIKGGIEAYRFNYYVEPEAGVFSFYLDPERLPKEEISKASTSGGGK